MISLNVPGWGQIEIKNLVLDFNGTLALDGKLIDGVAELLKEISKRGVALYVITADTNGTVQKECEGLPLSVQVYDNSTVAQDKRRLVQKLGARNTASIGNGRNDGEMFSASAVSVAVIGREGAFVKSALKADILVNNILDALELFLKDNRLKATLRG